MKKINAMKQMTLPRGAKKPLHRHDWIMHHLKNRSLLLYPPPIPFDVDENGNAYFIANGQRQYNLSTSDGAYIGAEGGYGLPIPEAMQVLAVASDTYHKDEPTETQNKAGKKKNERGADKASPRRSRSKARAKSGRRKAGRA